MKDKSRSMEQEINKVLVHHDMKMCIRDRGCLRTAADASADQSVYTVLHQEACQCTVTTAIGVNDFRMDDFAVRSFIKLELLGVAEMLKNLTVFIGNCNFHNGISFTIFTCFFRVGSLRPAAAAAVGCLCLLYTSRCV